MLRFSRFGSATPYVDLIPQRPLWRFPPPKWHLIAFAIVSYIFSASPWASFTILVDLEGLILSLFGVAAVLISFGAVIGKANPTQLLVMCLVETALYAVNENVSAALLKLAPYIRFGTVTVVTVSPRLSSSPPAVGPSGGLHFRLDPSRRLLSSCSSQVANTFGIVDAGGSLVIHVFGAFFSLAVSKVITPRSAIKSILDNGSSYRSDQLAMIGTLFLWAFWPSFNSALSGDSSRQRAIINTVLSLSGSCVATFFASSLLRGHLSM